MTRLQSFVVFLAAILMLNAFALSSTGVTGFTASRDYSSGLNDFPAAFAAGDFNRDGRLDFVVIGGSSLRIMLATASGKFVGGDRHRVGSDARAVAIGDLNGDGFLDLVVANNVSRDVSVLLGRGNGTFSSAFKYSAGAGLQQVVLGDFNNDNHLDVVVASSSRLYFFAGAGDGTLRAPLDVGAAAGQIVAADFNLDRKLDIVTGSTLRLGNGNGTFASPRATGGIAGAAMSVGDLNNDGRPDLVYASGANVSVLIGNGDGSFRTRVSYPAGSNAIALVIADFDRDGNADVVVISADAHNGPHFAALLLGNGNGTLRAERDYGLAEFFGATLAGDFNGDGFPDLALLGAATNGDPNDLSISYSLGRSGFQVAGKSTPELGDLPNPPFPQILITDLNGDGRPDIVYGSRINFATPSGGFVFMDGAEPLVGEYYENVAAGDFNGDGIPDLALGRSDIRISLGIGGGSFSPTPDTYSGGGAIVTADFNHDGKLDIASAFFGVLMGRGDGTFDEVSIYTCCYDAIGVGDFNRDGNADLVLGSGDTLTVMLGNGRGAFTTSTYSGVPTGRILVGDFNRDGKQDLMLGDCAVRLGNGNGTFNLTPLPAVKGAGCEVMGDFNGDGIVDVAGAYPASVALGKGDGTFLPGSSFSVGEFFTARVGAGDLNRDGFTDLVTYTLPEWVGSESGPMEVYPGALGIMLNTTATYVRVSSTRNPAPAGGTIALTATVNATVQKTFTPGGTVTFYDGTKLLGTAKLRSGTAQLSLGSLTVGTHTIKAKYSGDRNFNEKWSITMRQVVR